MAVDEAAVRNFAVAKANDPRARDRGLPLGVLYRFKRFKSMSCAAVRDWLRARPNDYLLCGQNVLVLAAVQMEGTAPKKTPSAMNSWCQKNLRCELCGIDASCADNMKAHLSSKRHQQALECASPQDIRRVMAACLSRPPDSLQTCELCGTWHTCEANFNAHMRSHGHTARLYYSLIRAAKLNAVNTHNVLVSQLPEPIPALEPGSSTDYSITITNLSGTQQTLYRAQLLQPVDGVSLYDTYGVTRNANSGGAGVPLLHGGAYLVNVRLAPRHLGLMRGLIIFDFGSFQTVRTLAATCADAETEAQVAATVAANAASGTNARRKRPKLQPQNADVVPGEPPEGADGTSKRSPKLKPAIGSHPVPKNLRELVEAGNWPAVLKRLGEPTVLPRDLHGFATRFKQLLWLEELQQEVDVQMYNLDGVGMGKTPSGRLLVLQVPGLAENRPSVLKGDRLFVKPSDGSSGTREWEGYVHLVQKEEVYLGFHRNFVQAVWVKGRKFDVRFSVNRSVFNRLQAVLNRSAVGDLNPLLLLPNTPAAPLPKTLPPGLPMNGPAEKSPHERPNTLPPPSPAGAIAWANKRLNDEQRLAVREVVRGAHHPLPYIVFGPPGTGKTSTVVEAAVQLLRTRPASRLLLAAPSNSAADQLFQRLMAAGRPKSELMRVCAYTRPKEDLPPDLRDLCGSPQINYASDSFLLPSSGRLKEGSLRAVVVTCATAAMLYHVGLPPGSFSHVIVDEAGHGEEPLVLATVAGLAGPDTRLIMSGDPKQLGPIIRSPVAGRYGLATSLLERLTGVQPFERREGGEGQAPFLSTYITKLLRNYRSHPAILEMPNAAFYHGELKPSADPSEINSLLHWRELGGARAPLLFHNLVGRDMQQAKSPSWSNLDEIKQVKMYVESLRQLKSNRVSGDQIGVISPYRLQVQHIRQQLAALDRSIKVGSVEEFQGQERRVVIISTVRSSSQYLSLDAKHRLGFLSNPKRLNVAITRAKALLVVVGNAQVLATDPHWRQLLRHIAAHGALAGQPLPPDLLTATEEKGGGEDGGGAGVGSVAEAELSNALQALVLNAAGCPEGNGSGALAELDEHMSYYGHGVGVEGGEIRRLE